MTRDDDLLAVAAAVGVLDDDLPAWGWADTASVAISLVFGWVLIAGAEIMYGGGPA